ncbi:MAG: type IX secretion system membrane protein PorP/SprF [Saprospiraceae bacterium]|nr:type IX secretion system membrane protein PorP/SprF [Saprospiraceae bacterium]MCB0622492.1 type IX secretion system membrane protein PorP/SprF [Saprospiraceae bacterium]MCB0676585.1 type IX secretion system membrane protein PorP/SprF [Saprospiraceae bacterium]MCB0682211.1 type IX secretion system membrane protein PorP/SprF [Saprospiraceae bacterium]
MKSLLTILISVLFLGTIWAQQEAHNTQFMYYKLGYNPGYAGSQEAPCFTGIYRKQWLGLEGSPELQILTFNMPLVNQRVGLGATVSRFAIGITEQVTANLVYAYRIRMGRGYLGLGLEGSVRSLTNNFQDNRIKATQPIELDGSIPLEQQQKFLLNFGAGAYYQGETFFVGLSIPRFLTNNIDFADGGTTTISREIRHLYLMGGFSIPLNETLSLQPQVLLKYVQNAPLDADINLSLSISNRYMAGITYRLGGSSVSGTGESLDVLLAAQLSEKFLLGVSYDLTLSEIKEYSTGSIELALRYCLGKPEGEEYVNPRFF